MPVYLLAVDFETTGGSASQHQGIQIGCLVVDAVTLQPVETFQSLIRYESRFQWTMGAERVHGISRARLFSAPPLPVVGARLMELLEKYWPTEQVPLMGHNVEFDRRFLHQLLEFAGFSDPKGRFAPKTVDTVRIARNKWGMGASAKVFPLVGVHRGYHDALQDAEACIRICRAARVEYLNEFEKLGFVSNRGSGSASLRVHSWRSTDAAV